MYLSRMALAALDVLACWALAWVILSLPWSLAALGSVPGAGTGMSMIVLPSGISTFPVPVSSPRERSISAIASSSDPSADTVCTVVAAGSSAAAFSAGFLAGGLAAALAAGAGVG